MEDKKELLTTKEVMQLLRCTKQNIYNLRKAGMLKVVKINKKVLFKKSDIERLIEENTI